MAMTALGCLHCWVLHRRPWRESSLMMDLFSLKHGRFAVVARGARGARSNWRGLCEPFVALSAQWRRRGELGTLTDLEPTQRSQPLLGSALWCGLYANELLLKLLERDESVPGLHQAYTTLIAELHQLDSADQGGALRRFEWALLQALGVAPALDFEAGQGSAIEAAERYGLDPEAGFVRVAAPSPHSSYAGEAILWVASGAVQPATADIRRQARAMLAQLIDHQLAGRELKTRALFRRTR